MTTDVVETTQQNGNILHETEHYVVAVHKNERIDYGMQDFDETPYVEPVRYDFVQGDGNNSPRFEVGYIVMNKTTKVVEFATISLPEAIYEAERLTDTFIMSGWKWFKIRRDAILAGEIQDENQAMLDMMKQRKARTTRGDAAELVTG